jgi:hypothetical protein
MVIFYIITDSLLIFTEIMLFGDLIADFRSDSFTKRIAGYLIVIECLGLESTNLYTGSQALKYRAGTYNLETVFYCGLDQV